MTTPKIMYVGLKKFKDMPNLKSKVTIASQLVDDELHVAFAFCNPKDTFLKKIGRAVAIGRLEKGNFYHTKSTGNSAADIARLLNMRRSCFDCPCIFSDKKYEFYTDGKNLKFRAIQR